MGKLTTEKIREFYKPGRYGDGEGLELVMERGLVSPVTEGTPQGGPLSPFLSNVVLDELDRVMDCINSRRWSRRSVRR